MDPRLKLLRHCDSVYGLLQEQFRPPVMVDVDPVEGVCNLDCEWCCQAASRASRPAAFMTSETMARLGPFCRTWGIKAWRISGDSEPLLNRQIDVLIDSGYAGGVDMGLITNGVYLNRVAPESLQRLAYLGVSLDAATAATWSRLKRSDPANFERIIDNVRWAKSVAPNLDISLKFVRWGDQSLHKGDFSGGGLPVIGNESLVGNEHEAEDLVKLAESLGVHHLVRQAYPVDLPKYYQFERCRATPLGGVFDAGHKFHLCCDARGRYVLTDDYTRDDWQELPRLWGGERHRELVASIEPQKCLGCAKQQLNELLEHVVVSPARDLQVNFI